MTDDILYELRAQQYSSAKYNAAPDSIREKFGIDREYVYALLKEHRYKDLERVAELLESSLG